MLNRVLCHWLPSSEPVLRHFKYAASSDWVGAATVRRALLDPLCGVKLVGTMLTHIQTRTSL